MILGSARLSFGSELSNSRIRNSPFSSRIGNDVLPDFCSGGSATRRRSQVLLLNRKTPGFNRHSTFIPSMLGRMSAGFRMGFSAKRIAMSVMVRFLLIPVTHDDVVNDGPFALVQHLPSRRSKHHDPRPVGGEGDVCATLSVRLQKLIADGVVNVPRLGPPLDRDRRHSTRRK